MISNFRASVSNCVTKYLLVALAMLCLLYLTNAKVNYQPCQFNYNCGPPNDKDVCENDEECLCAKG